MDKDNPNNWNKEDSSRNLVDNVKISQEMKIAEKGIDRDVNANKPLWKEKVREFLFGFGFPQWLEE